MGKKIRTIIFDIGSVLNDFHWKETFLQKYDEETARMLISVFSCGLWKEMDLGIRDEADILREFQSLAPGREALVKEAFEEIGDCKYSYAYSSKWIKELKKCGYQVLYLSNYSRHLLKTSPRSVDFLPLMDGGIFSWEVHLLKPDSRIFEILCRRYGILPEQCLFIDDRKENVDAAVRFGMTGIWFETFEDAYRKLWEILGVEKVK